MDANNSDSEDGEEGEITQGLFRKILDDLKFGAKSGRAVSGILDLGEETDLQEFLKQKWIHLANTNDKDMTLLQLIAETPKNEMPDIKNMKGLISALINLKEKFLGKPTATFARYVSNPQRCKF